MKPSLIVLELEDTLFNAIGINELATRNARLITQHGADVVCTDTHSLTLLNPAQLEKILQLCGQKDINMMILTKTDFNPQVMSTLLEHLGYSTLSISPFYNDISGIPCGYKCAFEKDGHQLQFAFYNKQNQQEILGHEPNANSDDFNAILSNYNRFCNPIRYVNNSDRKQIIAVSNDALFLYNLFESGITTIQSNIYNKRDPAKLSTNPNSHYRNLLNALNNPEKTLGRQYIGRFSIVSRASSPFHCAKPSNKKETTQQTKQVDSHRPD
jgi:hypothetical protein